jgi:hypothetical protein
MKMSLRYISSKSFRHALSSVRFSNMNVNAVHVVKNLLFIDFLDFLMSAKLCQLAI